MASLHCDPLEEEGALERLPVVPIGRDSVHL
jgi:hypothetical protein